MKIGCVVMASGLGTRFGSNKLLHDFHGAPMAVRILDTMASVPFDARVVVTRHPEVQLLCQARNLPCVLHQLQARRDTVRLGLEALLEACPRLDGAMFTAADQPRLKAESLAALCRAFSGDPDGIYRLSFQGVPGNPVLFPRSCFPELLALPEGTGGRAVIKAHPALVHLVEAAEAQELMDADTPAALEKLL